MPDIAALYTRVSTEDQAENGTSLEVQKKRLQDYAALNGIEIYRLYSDEGISGGSIEKRVAMKELLSDAANHYFNKVIVCKTDRLSRNLLDLLKIKSELDRNKIELIITDESVNPNDDSGSMMMSIMGAVAEFEKNRIASRMMSGKRELVAQGIKMKTGNILFGYDYNEETKTYVPNSESIYVKKAYDMYEQLYTLRQIDIYLYERLGNKSTNLAKRILFNPTYKGYTSISNYYYSLLPNTNKNVKNEPLIVKATNIIPIITEEQWDNVQSIRASKNGAVNKKATSDCFYLIDVLYCANCEKKMRSRTATYNSVGGKKEYFYYECYSKDMYYKYDKVCYTKSNVNINKIHAQFKDFIRTLNVNTIIAKNVKKNDISACMKDLANIDNSIKKKLKQKDTLLDKLSQELITDDDYSSFVSRINTDIAKLEEQKQELTSSIKTETELLESNESLYNMIRELKNLTKIWDKLSDKEKRVIVNQCIKRIEVKDKQITKIEFR